MHVCLTTFDTHKMLNIIFLLQPSISTPELPCTLACSMDRETCMGNTLWSLSNTCNSPAALSPSPVSSSHRGMTPPDSLENRTGGFCGDGCWRGREGKSGDMKEVWWNWTVRDSKTNEEGIHICGYKQVISMSSPPLKSVAEDSHLQVWRYRQRRCSVWCTGR